MDIRKFFGFGPTNGELIVRGDPGRPAREPVFEITGLSAVALAGAGVETDDRSQTNEIWLQSANSQLEQRSVTAGQAATLIKNIARSHRIRDLMSQPIGGNRPSKAA